MLARRIAVLDVLPEEVEARVREIAGDKFDIVFAAGADDAHLLEIVSKSHAILVGHIPATEELIRAAGPELKLLVRLGRGLDLIAMDTAADLGIDVVMTTGGNSKQVAEHVVMFMLAFLRRLEVCQKALRAGGWNRADVRHTLRGLAGRRVLLIGSGHISAAVHSLLVAFDARVTIVSRSPGSLVLDRRMLEDEVGKAEIVSIHLPLTPDTRHLVDEPLLERFARGSLLINTSRGAIVDERALVHALASGQLGGAALDVFETEPLPVESPLRSMPQVIMTPHIAGSSIDTVRAVAEHGIRDTLLYFDGASLPDEDWVLRVTNGAPDTIGHRP